jgi:hypothetical protein
MKEFMLILHFIGLAMGLGSGLAFLFLGIAWGKLEPAKQREQMLNAYPIARMGQYGLLLLVITGGYLMAPYWGALGQMPLLVAKLVLVLVLGAVVGINSSLARRARKGDTNVPLDRMPTLGRIAMLTTLAIVVLAVLVFQ